MGASARPESGGDRITRNIAAMRAQGASEHDVETYLTQHEGLAPEQDTRITAKNLGGSFVQGASLGWADDAGLTDPRARKAFQAAHPIADLLAKLGGGLVAPAAAVAAAPALGTTLGGAALLGAGVGAISGAGDAESGHRMASAAQGGLLGAGGGAAGYGVAKGLGAMGSALLNRMRPERVVAKSAAQMMTPEVSANLAQVEGIAPGGASIATTSAQRVLPMLRAVGANPDAGASAEASLLSQKTALETARKGIGAQMDAIAGDLPVTPATHALMTDVKEILGSKAPILAPNAQTMDLKVARDALSRLRRAERRAATSTTTSGPDAHDIKTTSAAMEKYIYTTFPQIEALDRPYAVVMGQKTTTKKALDAVQQSRAQYAANEAFGSTAGSLGGSLPSGAHGAVMTLLDKVLTNKAGAADAVARLIAKPGGPELIQQLLSKAPKPSRIPAGLLGTVGGSAAIPAMRGLLFPQD